MLQQNTRESALRREEFHRVLQEWLNESFDGVAGDSDGHAGPAWLWVRHGGAHYYLSGTATRAGIREYLRFVESAHGDPQWSAAPDSPERERIAVGPERRFIDGFEFYQHLTGR